MTKYSTKQTISGKKNFVFIRLKVWHYLFLYWTRRVFAFRIGGSNWNFDVVYCPLSFCWLRIRSKLHSNDVFSANVQIVVLLYYLIGNWWVYNLKFCVRNKNSLVVESNKKQKWNSLYLQEIFKTNCASFAFSAVWTAE